VNLPDRSRESATFDCDASGFVLAGGQSSRMGRDKALVSFGERPLIARTLAILREAGLSASIAGANPQANGALATFAPIVDDSQPGFGPLAGICAALAAVATRFVVFLPVDLPLLPSSLIAYMLHRARITGRAVTVPSVNAFAQTFPVVLDRSVFLALQNDLHSGQLGCFSAFQAAANVLGQPIASVAVELLIQSGQVTHPMGWPAAHWFLNVNTPQDLHRAEALMTQVIA
jgi:molybdopterin-guanine dinucleotide biosynthesis protein A